MMKDIRIILIVLRILILLLVAGFLCLAFMGVTGEVMTTSGLIILAILFFTRYLAKLYDIYMYRQNESKKTPMVFDRWRFDPCDYNDKYFDNYLMELVDFVASKKGDKVFIPKKNQKFQIWWDNFNEMEENRTGKVTKMTWTAEGKIIFETDSGNYLGDPSKCSDLDIPSGDGLNDSWFS